MEDVLHDDTIGMDNGQDCLATMSPNPQSERASNKSETVDNKTPINNSNRKEKWMPTWTATMCRLKLSL